MIKIAVLIDLLCMFIIIGSILKKTGFLKAIAISISFFCFIYAVFSGLLFLINSFSFHRVVGIITILLIPLAVFCLLKFRSQIRFEKTSLYATTIPIMLAVFTLLISITKFEVYDTGQDQGLYQAEAIELYMGNFEVQHDFEEYQLLEEPDEKEKYFEMLAQTITGYYPLSIRQFPTVNETEILSEVSGMYHGVQTFPVLLALGAKLFGLENMVQMQTIFFVCSILLLYFAINNLKIPLIANVASISVFLLSPLVIWVSKSSFTEMFLTLIMSCYLFLLTEADSKEKRILLSVPLFTFPFIHVSFLMIYPIFIFINIALYLYNSEKEYIYVNVITNIGLCLGYFMMSEIAPQYFFDNCSLLYFKNIITMDNFIYWIYGGALAVSVFSLLLLKLKNPNDIYEKMISISRFIPIISIGLLIFIFIYGILIGYFRTSEYGLLSYWGTGAPAFQHLTLYAFSMATGFILVPYLFYQFITKNKIFLSKPVYFCIYLLFLYCILFYSAFLRKEVQYYYYYSRYLVFYIPIISISFAILFMHSNRVLYRFVFLIAICGILPFSSVIIMQKDDTILEWDTLNDLAGTVKENSAIILKSPEIQKTLGVQLRALTNAAIFPEFENIETQLNLLKKHYDNVYFLSDTVAELEESKIVYRNYYLYSKNPVNPQKGIYPLTIPQIKKEMILYRFDGIYDSIDVLGTNTGVINAIKTSECIISSGDEGIVMFGPYISMPKGNYYLQIPIEIISSEQESLGSCRIGVNEKKTILPSAPLEEFLFYDEEKCYLKIPFQLDEYTENIEFIIEATEGSVFSVYSYDIYDALYGV